MSFPATLRAEAARQASSPMAWLHGVLLFLAWAAVFSGHLILSNVAPSPALMAQVPQALTASFWPFFLLLYAAASVAPDRQSGVLAIWASAPVSRTSLLAARVGCCLGYLVLSIFLIHGATWVAAMALGYDVEAHKVLDAAIFLAVGNILIFLPLVSLGVCCSTFFNSGVGAVAAAIGVYFFCDVASLATGTTDLFFASLYPLPFEIFYDRLADFPPLLPDPSSYVLWAAWTVLPLGAAFVSFTRKDLA